MLVTKTKVPDPVQMCRKPQQAEHHFPVRPAIRRSLIWVFVHAQVVFQLQATRPDERSKMLSTESQRGWTRGGKRTTVQVWAWATPEDCRPFL